jgi:hypothetical protein
VSHWCPADAAQRLPVGVTPRPGESLLGFLASADLANGLPAGTVASMVARHDVGAATLARPALGIIGTVFDLDALAVLTWNEPAAVLETTLTGPLRRIFGPDAGARRLGVVPPFRVCPACVTGPRPFVGRHTLYPLLTGCPRHGLRFATHCACGRPLAPFDSAAQPFACPLGHPWGEIPRDPLDARAALRQRRIAHAYEVILDRGDRLVVRAARELLDLDAPRRWGCGFCARDEQVERHVVPPKDIRSLTGLVADLVAVEMPPERLFEPASSGPHAALVCHNAACPTAGSSIAIRVSSVRSNGLETYCSECGSRFIGGRTVLSYDDGHGCASLSPRVVELARARLAEYRARIAAACDQYAGVFGPISVDHIFHVAGVPMASHLRARRLGLVALIKTRLPGVRARRVEMDPRFPWPDPSPRWVYPGARSAVEARREHAAGDPRAGRTGRPSIHRTSDPCR